ncbi:MAG: transglutaminase TgpA family protein, partial [Planctomycetota bacterium]
MSGAAAGTAAVPRALRWATTALALIGAGMYGMAEAVRASGNPLALLGVVILAFVPWLGKRHPLTVRGGTVLSLGIIFLAALDWWLFTNDIALAVGRVVLGLQVVRLWSPLGSRERLQVFLLSLTHCAAASVLTVDILFGVFFVGYAVVATWALVLQFLDQEARQCGAPPPRTSARLLAGISVLSVITIAFTAGIFLVVPRVGAGLLQTNLAANPVRMAGFSDEVRIGDIGEILRGDEEVMHVEFLGAETAEENPVRMRGRVFERCWWDPKLKRYLWNVPTAARKGLGEKVPDRRITVATIENATRGVAPREFVRMQTTRPIYLGEKRFARPPTPVQQRVTLQPMTSPALFFAGPPRTIRYDPGRPTPGQLRIDPGGNVVEWPLAARNKGEIQYTAEVWLDPVDHSSAHRPGPALAPEHERPWGWFDISHCGSRPEGMAAALWDRLRAQGRSWARDATDPWQVAEEIERRLVETGGYTYSLDMPDPNGADPIEHFLFNAKSGHCEYYAMSMVMLMRAAGYEARLVTGFVGGEVNPIGDYRLIRQSDAHAWVEVLSADRKWWRAFDPTPRADPGAGSLAIVGQLIDWMKFRWYSGVVDYDIHDQRRALLSGARSARTWSQSIKAWLNDAMTGTRGLRGLVGLGVIVAGLWLLFGRKRWSGVGGGRRGPSIAFYAELLRLLEREGVRRKPGQTPREFAAAVRGKRRVPSEPVALLTDLFCRSRYGEGTLDDTDRSRAQSALESVRA